MSEAIYPTTIEYRLHKIKTSERAGQAFATIYDGTKKVFRTYGNNMGNAIMKAKRWIDEQDELPAAYDLHVA
ncbi:hypothetical protein KFU94_25475 [Chloroflexi bacterium TSY]|nr:hypothetical protein [Chloroflexi bacterium TSY]